MIKECNEELLKVAFIDDEKLVRKLLMNCVDWNALGFMIAGESPGGEHALDLISQMKPDLIFVDICMPIMDGIQMSSSIMKTLPDSRIIIVTGHQEFEYARESIKVGVFDYLLKPINPNEITEAAIKAKEEIKRTRQEQLEHEELRHRLEDHYPRLKEQCLVRMLQGDEGGELQSLEHYDIIFKEAYFQIAVAAVELNDAPQNLNANDIRGIFARKVSGYERVYFMNCGELHVVLSNNREADLCEALKLVRSEISINYDCMVSGGVSNVFNSMVDIPNAYTQARQALNYKVVCGKGHIIKYADILNGDRESGGQNNQIELLKLYIKSGLVKNAESAVSRALDELMSESAPSSDLLHAAGARVLSACLSVMMECGIPESELFGREGNAFEALFDNETLPQMKQHLGKCANEIASKIFEMNKSGAHGVVQGIKTYVEANISDPNLSLSSVAAKFYINPSYLSRIYRQETGITFVDDMNRTRMDMVRRMLNESDMKVYELCERVGIEDPHYLSIVFKKYTGMTISEYKHMLRDQTQRN